MSRHIEKWFFFCTTPYLKYSECRYINRHANYQFKLWHHWHISHCIPITLLQHYLLPFPCLKLWLPLCLIKVNSKQFFNQFVNMSLKSQFLFLMYFNNLCFLYLCISWKKNLSAPLRFDCKCTELWSNFSCYGFLTLCMNPQSFKGTVVIFNNIIRNSLKSF